MRHRLPAALGVPQAGGSLLQGESRHQQHPHTNLDLHGVLLGPVPIILLLALHELPEVLLDQEGGIEFAHCHLIIWREESNMMVKPM